MSALRWKRRPPTLSTARTASSSSLSSVAHSINVVPISPTMGPSSSVSGVSITPVSATPVAAVAATGGAHIVVESQPQRAKLKLAIDTQISLSTPASAGTRSPGCFRICGWANYTAESPVDPAAKGSIPAAASSSSSGQTSPIGSPSHCYSAGRANPCSVQQLTSPVRGNFRFLPTFRKPVVCGQCKAILNVDNAEKKQADIDSAHQQSSATVSSSSPSSERCVVCCKANAFETQLSKSFFSPRRVDGKSVCYPGLPVESYRQWFKERPMTPDVVLKTEAKRAKMLKKLQQQHKLHYPKLKDVCSEICAAFAAATCFVSVADAHLELIVGNYGSMLHFSCLPREVGMCDYTMGVSEQCLLVSCVADDPVFRENPLLHAVKAQFYLGVPILARGIVIGAIAVIDESARREPLDAIALALMTHKAELMGGRVTALLVGGSHSSFTSRVVKQRSR